MFLSLVSDTHGRVEERLANLQLNAPIHNPKETAVIILGDVGLNFYLNNTDRNNKRKVNSYGYTIYCVQGNHEQRPNFIPGMEEMYDENVKGNVYYEPEFPNIRYFHNGFIYEVKDYRFLVIGGAYSVDKYWRLHRAGLTGVEDPDYIARRAGWFIYEQLTPDEMIGIQEQIEGEKVDFVFTHTCPFSWIPDDLFISAVDQSTVDNRTEKWLEEIKDSFEWDVWLFGHYHADRLERPYVEQYYLDCQEIDAIWDRWHDDGPLDWWLIKSPNYYMALDKEESN